MATAVKMGRLRKFGTTLRNHWKKSTLAFVLGSFGVQQAIKKNQEVRMMTDYCKEAQAYGEQSIGRVSNPAYHVTVILNPASDGGKGRNKYENYCEPLLHLAGFKVSTIRTEAQGQAKDIAEKLDKSDAVLVAGGDGSLMEAITGIMRRPDVDQVTAKVPVGILPLGKENHTAKQLFPGIESDVKLMAEAAMSVVRGLHKRQDVMQVENVSDNPTFRGKKIYCLRQIQMGSLIDAHMRVDKYWYLPFIKKYVTYFFTYLSSSKSILRNCSGSIDYAKKVETEEQPEPAVEQLSNRAGFWSYIVPSAPAQIHSEKKVSADYQWEDRGHTDATEMVVNIDAGTNADGVSLYLAPEQVDLQAFMSEGWSREYNKRFTPDTNVTVDGIRWNPDFESESEGDEKFFYMDNEAIEIVGPVEVTLVPKKFRMFCHQSIHEPLAATSASAPKPKLLTRRMESASFSNRL